MPKTITAVDKARQELIAALDDAYGCTQQTPAGEFCRIGRIDRAYELAAQHPDNQRYQAALRKLLVEYEAAYRHAVRTIVNYQRVCRQQNKPPHIEEPVCTCPVCSSKTPGCKSLNIKTGD